MPQTHMPKTKADLRALVEYLIAHHELPQDYRELRIIHDPVEDARNDKDPRAFCAVHDDEWAIRCALDLEFVNPTMRMGILLHEVGHHYLHAFSDAAPSDDEFEVEVDEWCVRQIPEAHYTYADQVYRGPGHRRLRTAKNIQRVSGEFVWRIKDGH